METVLWVYFAWERVIPLWAPFWSSSAAASSTPYARCRTRRGHDVRRQPMMRSALTRWLTAGRFMRGLYGYVKAAAFIFLTGYYGYVQPQAAGTWLDKAYSLTSCAGSAGRTSGWRSR